MTARAPLPGRGRQPLLVASSLLLAPLLALPIGCGSTASRVGGPKSATGKTTLGTETSVATTTVIDGTTLVELTVGTADRIRTSDFFHILGSGAEAPLKATVMVTEVLGPHRSVAKLVGGLLDRNNPVVVGDQARFLHDLSSLGSLERLEESIAEELADQDRHDHDQSQAHRKIRATYEARLQELGRRHQAELAAQAQDFERELAALQARHQRELERRDSLQQAELATLRAALTDEAKAAIKAERDELRATIDELRTANASLSERIATLLEDQQAARDKLVAIEARRTAAEQRHRAELLAEAEARSVLEERIARLQARIDGEIRPEKPVLPFDPDRNETILERLERVVAEAEQARTEANDLRDRLALVSTERDQLRQRLVSLEQQIAAGGDGPASESLRQRIAELESTAAALELAQLRSERAYYDLSTRIFHLPDENAAVKELQQRLQQALQAARAPDQTPDQEGP